MSGYTFYYVTLDKKGPTINKAWKDLWSQVIDFTRKQGLVLPPSSTLTFDDAYCTRVSPCHLKYRAIYFLPLNTLGRLKDATGS